jgi:hypothetical protein
VPTGARAWSLVVAGEITAEVSVTAKVSVTAREVA